MSQKYTLTKISPESRCQTPVIFIMSLPYNFISKLLMFKDIHHLPVDVNLDRANVRDRRPAAHSIIYSSPFVEVKGRKYGMFPCLATLITHYWLACW